MTNQLDYNCFFNYVFNRLIEFARGVMYMKNICLIGVFDPKQSKLVYNFVPAEQKEKFCTDYQLSTLDDVMVIEDFSQLILQNKTYFEAFVSQGEINSIKPVVPDMIKIDDDGHTISVKQSLLQNTCEEIYDNAYQINVWAKDIEEAKQIAREMIAAK